MKRTLSLAVLIVALLVPLWIATAADVGNRDVVKFGQARMENGYVIVPVIVVNDEQLVAVDLPLKYSEGAVLEKVEFAKDRVGHFEGQFSRIDADQNQVILGLISTISSIKEDLVAGNGPVAELYFKVNNGVSSFSIDAAYTKTPHHEPMLIYNDWSTGKPSVQVIKPEFQKGEITIGALNKPALPTRFELTQNSPNPFNPTTRIRYALPQSGIVRLEIFNILGQRVKLLVDGYEEAGFKSVVWDGTDDNNNTVASGVYLYRIKAQDFSDVKKMTLLK